VSSKGAIHDLVFAMFAVAHEETRRGKNDSALAGQRGETIDYIRECFQYKSSLLRFAWLDL
jgi:hypothetical protein